MLQLETQSGGFQSVSFIRGPQLGLSAPLLQAVVLQKPVNAAVKQRLVSRLCVV